MQLNVRLDDGVPVVDSIGQYADAIGSLESAGSGGYQAIGPDTGGGSRAYGRYQVMDYNIGPWTQEVFGRALSPQEFLASPQAQDQVFRHKFGEYVKLHGPQGAAAKWFSGSPSTTSGASDVLGTSVPAYVSKFNAALGQGGGQPSGQPAPYQFGLPVVNTAADVIDLQSKRGINDIAGPESGGAKSYSGGGRFGSRWRDQAEVDKYAGSVGLDLNKSKLVAAPQRTAEIKQFEKPQKPTTPSLPTDPRKIQNTAEAYADGLAQRGVTRSQLEVEHIERIATAMSQAYTVPVEQARAMLLKSLFTRLPE